MTITVLGAGGFIGGELVRYLAAEGIPHRAIGREDTLSGALGHVVYCIGLTADFRSRPLDTVEAHVCKLREVLRTCDFDSLTYLSSTRVYAGARLAEGQTHIDESQPLSVDSTSLSDLYNLSKLMGESLGLHGVEPGRIFRAVRLSNVYGADWTSDNFLTSIIKVAVDEGQITLQSALDSAKDYISVSDVVRGLHQIATRGTQLLYNLAAGHNTTHRAIVERLSALTGCRVSVAPDAPAQHFPPISIQRFQAEFGHHPASLLDNLADLVADYRQGYDS